MPEIPRLEFPPTPFYLMSKIGDSTWILTLTPDGAVVMRQLAATIDQIWMAIADPRGGSFLRHVHTGLVLTCQQAGDGPLKASNFDAADPNQLWVRFNASGGWSGLTPFEDLGGLINVYGSDVNGTIGISRWQGGADNEKWNPIEETGQITVDSIAYDISNAVSELGMPPSHCTATIVDNLLGGVPAGTTYQLARTVSTQHTVTSSESDMTGHSYTQTFGVKGGIDKVVEVSAQASFTESDSKTISLTDGKTVTESLSDTITTQVTVPAGKKYSYEVVVFYGKVTVPYTAQLTFTSSTAGAPLVKITTTGVFTGVNSTKNEITISDITSPELGPKLVVRVPVV